MSNPFEIPQPIEATEAPHYGGEEVSPYFPAEDPNVPEATVGGISSDFEPSEVKVPTNPDQNQVEAASSAVWDRIEAKRADATRHSMGSVAVSIKRP